MKLTSIGFIVVEVCDDWEQPLTLSQEDGLPEGGLLVWSGKPNRVAHVFPTKSHAREAIERTDHYAKAFGATDEWPKKGSCKIVRLQQEVVEAEEES